ncbi:MAG: transketolase C-terminal domain-containing protein [Candidatus Omnitrophota bacterium]
MTKSVPAMRDAFFDALYDIAKKDKRVILVTADCGAPSLDRFRQDLSDQYFTVGIAEQNMISIAAGLALDGKIVYTYAIAPFASLRCYEQIKVDLCCMNLAVTIIGVGTGFAYDIMGPTHHATEDISIMRALPEMTIFNPSDSIMAGGLAQITYRSKGPKYVRFDRGGLPLLYSNKKINFSNGLVNLKKGSNLCIISTGVMVYRALQIANELSKHSIDAGVVDLYRIKPLNVKLLLEILDNYENILTLEEHFVIGGIGSIMAEVLSDNEKSCRLKRLGICDRYYFEYGGRERLHELCCLDTKSVVKTIVKWISERKRR